MWHAISEVALEGIKGGKKGKGRGCFGWLGRRPVWIPFFHANNEQMTTAPQQKKNNACVEGRVSVLLNIGQGKALGKAFVVFFFF
jgi:hypothetical protein